MDVTLPGSYINVASFISSKSGVDTSLLSPGELARILFNASRTVDGICKQPLYSTIDTVELLQDGREGYSIDLSDGILKIFTKRFPIRSITSITQQYSSSDSPAAIASGIHIDSSARWAWLEGNWSAFKRGLPPMYLKMVYLNGWMATTLSATANSAQKVIVLVPQPGQANVVGVFPGQTLMLQDGVPEVVTVFSVAGNSVTLVNNLVSQHVADTMVVEPSFNELSFGTVQKATMDLAAYDIKSEGIAPLVLQDESIRPSNATGPAQDLWDKAVELLRPFTVYA